MAGPCQNREQGAAPTLAKRARPRPLSEGHLGGSAAPLQPHVGVKTNVQSRGVGVPEGEVSSPSFPPFFPFRRGNASMHPCLGRHPSPFFFFFGINLFSVILEQCWLLPPRLEAKSASRARSAERLLRPLCPGRASAGARRARRPQPWSLGTFDGAGRSRSVPPENGERRRRARPPHRPIASSLAPAPRPTATGVTDPPAVPAPRKGAHNSGPGPGSPEGEAVGISLRAFD